MPLSKPREKLQSVGITNLTDTELLCLLLGSGSKKQPILSLSKKILHQFPLLTLDKVAFSELQKIDGIGKAQASRLSLANVFTNLQSCHLF
jgi:DNA repair protein RadC